jgi:ATP-dependent Clp protease ATP-binding subunit ClpC
MLIDANGVVESRFERGFLKRHEGFMDVLTKAAITGCARVEPSHFLLALLEDERGYTAARFVNHGLQPAVVAETVTEELHKRGGGAPLFAEKLDTGVLSPRSRDMVEDLEALLAGEGFVPCEERHLLWAVLRHLEEDVSELLKELADFDPAQVAEEIRAELGRVRAVTVFDPVTGDLDGNAFTRRGWRAVELARAEAEAYGLPRIDSLVLLLALVTPEDGVARRGLVLQGASPVSVHQSIVLNIRKRPKRSVLTLNRASFFESAQRVLERSAQEAAGDGQQRIGERHLLRAWLRNAEGAGKHLLEDRGVDLSALYRFACHLEEADEAGEDRTQARLPSFEEIEARLKEVIVGQDQAIATIMPYIKRARFGYFREGRPAGVFLFVGDPGVGKTQMAKLLAEAVYGSEDKLIMIEMGQMGTSESCTLLIGAPPGYVGYGEGKLTNGLRDKPQSVVLFDEMEKAHPLVFDVLLRFLNEGQIEDPAGPVRDGRQCLVILTSNLPLTYEDVQDVPAILSQLRSQEPFRSRPELLSRVDAVVPFRSLDLQDFREIARRQLSRDAKRLREEKEIEMVVEDGVVDLIAERSFGRRQGARAVDREITELVIMPVIDLLQVPRPARILVRRLGDGVVCQELAGPGSDAR